jgi:selenocysteine lyase/cysteine desulfurase
MTDSTHSRREFLGSLAALSAAGLAPGELVGEAGANASASASASRSRGAGTSSAAALAAPGLAAPGDFGFAPGLVYLQTGSLGPTPRPVMERAIAAWKELELNPASYGYGEHEQAMDAVRAKAAAFIGCKMDELVLTTCTTEGINSIAQGLTFAPGDRVLTTDQEHPGGRVGWDHVARRQGVALDIVVIPPGENDAQAIVDRFAKQITPRTRVLSFSHLLSSTGLRMPVAELSALARRRECIAVVDGAQAAGGISVNVKALGCHAYAASGHKWLMAPPGTGLLYLSEELGGTIDPIKLQSGRAAYTASTGVCSIPSVLGLGAAVDYITAIGITRIESHDLALRNRLFAALATVPKLRVVSAAPGALASPLLTFSLPESVKSGALHDRLRQKHNIEVKVVPENWFNGNRISTHLFNTEREVDALVAALKEELA